TMINFILHIFLISVGVLITDSNIISQTGLRNKKYDHTPSSLSRTQILKLSDLSNVNHMNEVLDNICVVRIVGTPEHTKVKHYIKRSMKDLGWTVESDNFEDQTPIFGVLQFENIIAKLNPDAKRYLALACHYDSKYTRERNFEGAIDSAVPCAQMINLAKVMKNHLKSIKHVCIDWIDLLVLLDLIGAPDPTFYNYFKNTENWYSLLMSSESKLASFKKFESYSYGQPTQTYFQPYSVETYIEDDHIPFLRRDIPILHLIPYPFPKVWHKPSDNRNNIDLKTNENINKILRIFVASYLHINI
ncbi:Glutaminyl-peptide cyclotransferase, partial [Melipona quadrifasciata]